jgi:hypothetical protein
MDMQAKAHVHAMLSNIFEFFFACISHADAGSSIGGRLGQAGVLAADSRLPEGVA